VQESTTRDGGADVRRSPVWPHLVALATLAVTLIVGLLVYPSAPDPMPVHFDGGLQPDAWAGKNLGGFLSPVFIGAAAAVIFWIAAVCLPLSVRTPSDEESRTPVSGPASTTQLSLRSDVSVATAEATMRLLGHLTIATAGLISILALATWIGVPAWMAPLLLPVLMGAFFGSLAGSSLRVFRAQRGLA